MWLYEKVLEYPVQIKKPDAKMAKLLLAQYGGPDGELSAALQYFNQRYTMKNTKIVALLTDIGTEELAHLEIVASMIRQLTRNLSLEELKQAGLGEWYAQYGDSLFYTNSLGVPWSANYISSTGDPITDLYSDLALEQKARTTYENLINVSENPEVSDVLKFLREREIVHFQRFGEALELLR